GAKLIVVDPVRVGFAAKADEWLRVRPGSDGALALSLAHVLISEDRYDREFVAAWTNAPFLLRADTGAMLTGADLGGDPAHRVAWDAATGDVALYDTGSGQWIAGAPAEPLLRGEATVAGTGGAIRCQPVFERYAALCAEYPPERAAGLTWIDAEQIRATARLIGESDAVSCSTWAGLEMHSNTSQTARAISCLYALTGSFDAPGGNVVLERLPVATIFGEDMVGPEMRAKALGREQRPLGPESIFGWITTDALYRAVLEREPYGVDALVSFGLNMLLSHADGARGARALEQLDFMVHADLFMTPTARYADIFLPVNTPWERDALKTDFYADQRASAHAQYRPAVIESRGESRSDAWIAAELGRRLGGDERFWHGDLEAAHHERLAPSGVSLDELKANPRGVTVPLETRYRKYAGDGGGSAPGFHTPSRRVELFSETLFAHGYAALPEYTEPATGPLSRPELAERFPLVLTDTKSPHYIHSQYRHVGRLRRHEREPRIDVHPDTAAARGIGEGDLVELTTPHGRARARARFAPALDPRVVRATAGWWQACEPLSLPGYDALADDGANLNRTISNADVDPIGGCVPQKSFLCEIAPVTA
ncbi:MAG: molybdopterin dinucleotide binding domain-containing protein, partial [Gammaproteobacteria bacterium]